eukprot:sb/3476782/
MFCANTDKPMPNYPLLKKTHPEYSRDEIKEMFDKFCEIDDTGDYRLSADEICVCLKKIGKPVPKRIVQEQIRKFDVRQSGVLEFDEFLNFLRSLGKGGAKGVTSGKTSTVCSIQ